MGIRSMELREILFSKDENKMVLIETRKGYDCIGPSWSHSSYDVVYAEHEITYEQKKMKALRDDFSRLLPLFQKKFKDHF